MASSLIDVCRFNPTAGGTTDWTYSSAVTGYQSPTAAGAVNGAIYSYRAESNDLSQWEMGYGAYNSSTGVFARTTVLFNSSGTTSKINFSTVPQVALVALAEDLPNAAILRGYLGGLTLSTAGSSATFSVAAGVAVDSTNSDWMKLGSAISKTLSANWTVGTGNGGLDAGSSAASTWYHIHLIKRPDTGVVDVLFSLSATAPTLPTNYTLFRRIGSLLTNGSTQWVLFNQNGDELIYSIPFNDINVTNLGTTATLYALTVPPGVKVNAIVRFFMANASSGTVLLINSPDEAVASANSPLGNVTAQNPVAGASGGTMLNASYRTDTSKQIRAVASAASTTFILATCGYIDKRGKDN